MKIVNINNYDITISYKGKDHLLAPGDSLPFDAFDTAENLKDISHCVNLELVSLQEDEDDDDAIFDLDFNVSYKNRKPINKNTSTFKTVNFEAEI